MRRDQAMVSVHLANAYHPTSGGIRTFFHALLAGAERHGRHVHVVVPAARDAVEPWGRFGRVHHVAAAPLPCFDRRYRVFTPRHYLRAAAPLRRLLADLRPDVVEIADKFTLPPLAWLLRALAPPVDRPTLVAFSNERMDDTVTAYLSRHRAWRRATSRYLRHVCLPAVDAQIANSVYTAEELVAAGASPAAVHVSTMGVDTARLAAVVPDPRLRRRLCEEAGGTAASALVLYAGRLAPEKHLPLLVEAVARLQRAAATRLPARDVRLILVGDGPEAATLDALGRRLCAHPPLVRPHLADPGRLARHYAAADVFVHPNPREPFGIGPLEAMAVGTPVVVPRSGGVLSYAHDGNAWLAQPDGAGLAAAIVAALAAGRGHARVDCARRTAADFAWPAVVDRYFALLDRLHARRLAAGRRALRAGRVPGWLTSRG